LNSGLCFFRVFDKSHPRPTGRSKGRPSLSNLSSFRGPPQTAPQASTEHLWAPVMLELVLSDFSRVSGVFGAVLGAISSPGSRVSFLVEVLIPSDCGGLQRGSRSGHHAPRCSLLEGPVAVVRASPISGWSRGRRQSILGCRTSWRAAGTQGRPSRNRAGLLRSCENSWMSPSGSVSRGHLWLEPSRSPTQLTSSRSATSPTLPRCPERGDHDPF
jgi:hypothetical protein